MNRPLAPEAEALIDMPEREVEFDLDAFDSFIRGHGVTFRHWRAMRCPVGMVDQHDVRRPHEDHEGCSNGFLYTEAGDLTILISGNSKDSNRMDPGIMDGSVIQVTFPRFYDRSLPTQPEVEVDLAPFDRLYLAQDKITVVHWQLFEAHPTGRDRLTFPAESVSDLVDSSGKRYAQGRHFDVQGGQVRWTGAERPGWDPDLGKGRVCAVRYRYRPWWYLQKMLHEVRVSQSDVMGDGTVVAARLPQAAMLAREYVHNVEDADPEAKNFATSSRQAFGPPQSGFGTR